MNILKITTQDLMKVVDGIPCINIAREYESRILKLRSIFNTSLGLSANLRFLYNKTPSFSKSPSGELNSLLSDSLLDYIINTKKVDYDYIDLVANKFIIDSSRLLCNPQDWPLFNATDKYQEFIYDTKFIKKYTELLILEQKIKKHCNSYIDELDSIDFLFDEGFILPIDITNSKINFSKIPNINTINSSIITKRYNYYIEQKEKLIFNTNEYFNSKGISNLVNPFYKMQEKIKANSNNYISLLQEI